MALSFLQWLWELHHTLCFPDLIFSLYIKVGESCLILPRIDAEWYLEDWKGDGGGWCQGWRVMRNVSTLQYLLALFCTNLCDSKAERLADGWEKEVGRRFEQPEKMPLCNAAITHERSSQVSGTVRLRWGEMLLVNYACAFVGSFNHAYHTCLGIWAVVQGFHPTLSKELHGLHVGIYCHVNLDFMRLKVGI